MRESKYWAWVHGVVLGYVSFFMGLVLVYALGGIFTEKYVSRYSYYIFLVLGSFLAYLLIGKWKEIGKLPYHKLWGQHRLKIGAAAGIAAVLVLVQGQQVISGWWFLILFAPQMVLDLLIFPLVHFFPFEDALLILTAPMAFIVEYLYIQLILGWGFRIARKFYKKKKRS